MNRAVWLMTVACALAGGSRPAPAFAQAEHDAHADAVTAPITEEDRLAAFPDLGDLDARAMMLEDPLNSLVLFDQLELSDTRDSEMQAWDLSAWVGHDFNRIWIRSKGERRNSETEHAEIELLWGHSFARWWDVVAGVRHDFAPGSDRSWAALGIQGLAPYSFEVEATAFIGESGHTAARVESEVDLLLTNRLILQPHIELNWHGQSDPGRGIGTGLSTSEMGLRLRYEIRREVAPYVGYVRETKYGATADLSRAAGDGTRDDLWVLGIRLWF